ncbi:MAG: hypothetical protein M1828_004325 [Chrysothrix sp. TS-e1954]|nr:MAG: hypothetical protein M1828_004325 [Chrysothrix sp. TS-e1954]
MASPRVIIVTGASKGIGLAIANLLCNQEQNSRVIAVARSQEPLEKLKNESEGRAEVLVGDLGKDMSMGQKAVDLAIKSFGRLDGLIINHGTLTGVAKLGESSVEQWRAGFDINVFSTIALIKAALPSLRDTKGTILLTSSGAAVKATSTWGCYGASKAVLNHLAMTLAVEEPDITTIAIRPGVVDTDMQAQLKSNHFQFMDDHDVHKFESLRSSGKMLKPEQPGHFMARLVLAAPHDLNGKFVKYARFQLSREGTNARNIAGMILTLKGSKTNRDS